MENQKVPAVCRRGHRFTPDNIIVGKDGYPRCRQCMYLAQRRYRAKKKQLALL